MGTPDLAGICGDLAAEHEALDAFVAPLDAPAWKTPTPAEGWDIGDAMSHLAFFDEKATMAIVDPDAFAAELTAVWEDPSILLGPDVERGRAMESAELLGWWRTARARLLDAAASCDPNAKVAWYGPPMNPVSFVSARLMETWAHGVDVLDALGVPVASTASGRLRHIAHIGVRTRGWSYTVRGLTAPTAPVRVELVPPGGGDLWVWGDSDAGDAVRGSALEFCLLVTQRRNRADTGIDATGAAADEWLDLAQAFAEHQALAAHRCPPYDRARPVRDGRRRRALRPCRSPCVRGPAVGGTQHGDERRRCELVARSFGRARQRRRSGGLQAAAQRGRRRPRRGRHRPRRALWAGETRCRPPGARAAAGRPQVPPLAVVSANLSVDPDASLFVDAEPRTILVTTDRADTGRFDDRAVVVRAGAGTVDLARAMGELKAAGHDLCLCEGGPSLNAALLSAGLVDELCLTIAPLIAANGSPLLYGTPMLPEPEAFDLADVLVAGNHLLLRYVGSDHAG